MVRFFGVLFLGLILVGILAGCAGIVLGSVAAANVAHDRRTSGIVLDDQSIESKIYSQINEDKTLAEQAYISVTSYNYVVLLTGEVPSEGTRQWVEGTARRTEKVKDVYNELIVAPPSAVVSRNADTWITAKVKTSLFGISLPDFDPSRVKVVTSQGTVYLFGLLTQTEADIVVETVRRVENVQRVITLFEYIIEEA